MITIVEVMKAVSGMAEGLFGAPPVTKDIREGFPRPCTYLSLLSSRTAREGGLRHDTADLELVRFAARTDQGWIDLLRAQAALTEALDRPIRVSDGFSVLAEEIDFDPVREDMALYCTFSVEWYQLRDEDEDPAGSGDPMEILTVNNDEIYAKVSDCDGTA